MAGILDSLTATSIANYARGAFDGISQNNPLFAKFKETGRIKYDVGGTTLDGVVESGRHQPTISAPGQDLSALFTPKVRHSRYSFPWAELVNALVVDRGMLRRNSGDQALVKLKDEDIPALMRDLIVGTDGLAHQLLQKEGQAYTGNGLPFYGFPSFLPAYANTANLFQGFDGIATGTGTTPTDSDVEVLPYTASNTYGGLSMQRSGLAGIDGLEPDAWTPTLVNTSATVHSGTADDEANAILVFLQYLVNRCCRFSSSDQSKIPNLALLDGQFFGFLGNKIAAKQTIYVQTSQKTRDTPNLGYNPHKLFHAGMEWMWEENMPALTAYCINTKQMELSIQPLYKDQENGSPLTVSGEDAGIIETAINFDPLRRQYLVSGTIPGQLKACPRYQGRAMAYS